MHVYGLKVQTVLFGQDIDPAYKSMSKEIETIGPREYVVTGQYSNKYGRITHCLTCNDLFKAHKRRGFYVRDINLKKIQIVHRPSLTKEEILERFTQKHPRSAFVINVPDSENLNLRDILCEIPFYYGMDAISGKRHPENCPYDYCFEVK